RGCCAQRFAQPNLQRPGAMAGVGDLQLQTGTNSPLQRHNGKGKRIGSRREESMELGQRSWPNGSGERPIAFEYALDSARRALAWIDNSAAPVRQTAARVNIHHLA